MMTDTKGCAILMLGGAVAGFAIYSMIVVIAGWLI